MITLEISSVVVLLGLAAVGAAAYAFYRMGKRKGQEQSQQPSQQPQQPLQQQQQQPSQEPYIKENPNTPQAKVAFINNLSRLMPFFSGVSEIKIDRENLTDVIIDINDEDLTGLWNKMVNRPELWINQMAAWGVAPDTRQEFMAMEKHLELYSTKQGETIEIGKQYKVLSACWILTTTDDKGASTKKVVKKGIAEPKQ